MGDFLQFFFGSSSHLLARDINRPPFAPRLLTGEPLRLPRSNSVASNGVPFCADFIHRPCLIFPHKIGAARRGSTPRRHHVRSCTRRRRAISSALEVACRSRDDSAHIPAPIHNGEQRFGSTRLYLPTRQRLPRVGVNRGPPDRDRRPRLRHCVRYAATVFG
jgi:hypothetical protein